MNIMIMPGMLVCSSFLNNVCMFIVSTPLLISSATVIDMGLYEASMSMS